VQFDISIFPPICYNMKYQTTNPNVKEEVIRHSGLNNQSVTNKKKKEQLPSLASSRNCLYTQLLSVIAVNFGALSIGLANGFSTVLRNQITKDTSNASIISTSNDSVNITSTLYNQINLDDTDEKWLDWSLFLGAAFGGLLSACIGHILGSRRMLILLALPDILGWILIAASQNIPMLLSGRFLTGIAGGGYYSNIQIYVVEISQTLHRGWLAGLTIPILATGVLAMHLVGSWLAWPYAAALAVIVPCLLAGFSALLWDTPYWLTCQENKEKSAMSALQHFRGRDLGSLEETIQMQECIGNNLSLLKSVMSFFSNKKYYTPFFILNTLFLMMTFSGKFTIGHYTSILFQHASGNRNESFSSVVTAFLHLIGSCIFIPLVRTFPRKLLIVTSALVMGLSLTLLGVSMYSQTEQSPAAVWISQADWIPIMAATTYLIAAPAGFCSIPYIYAAAFFPIQVRSLLSGLTICITNLSMLLLMTTFPITVSSLGHPGLVWGYAVVCFLAICLTLAFIPETRDSTLGGMVEEQFSKWRKADRASPWVTPASSPAMGRKGVAVVSRSEMFTK